MQQVDLQLYTYQLNEEGPSDEMADDSEELAACKQWILPSKDFDGLWERFEYFFFLLKSLVFDESIKYNLLDYAFTTLLFSDMSVNTNLISWNRVILLHGPAGTGTFLI